MGIQAPISGDNIREIQQKESRIAQEKAVALASAKAQLTKQLFTANSNCFMAVGDNTLVNLNQVSKVVGTTFYFVDGSELEVEEEFNVLLENLKSSTYVDVLENSDGN